MRQTDLAKDTAAITFTDLAAGELLEPLRQAAARLRAFVDAAECTETETSLIAKELDDLIEAAPTGAATEIEVLLHALTMQPPASCATGKDSWSAYRKKGKWQAALKASRSLRSRRVRSGFQ